MSSVSGRSFASVATMLVLTVSGCGTTDGTANPDPVTDSPTSSVTTSTETTIVPMVTSNPVETTLAPTTSVAPREEYVSIGTSVEGREIGVVHRLDLPGARLPVDDPDRFVLLVIGVIHGDEQAGLEVVGELLRMSPEVFVAHPDLADVDLWLLPSMNPDGVVANRRTNTNLVDLNRNFPHDWGPIAEPGNWQYAGSSAASEPETRAVVDFVDQLRPDLTVWYHQDAYSIAPSSGPDGPVREEYARLTGLPLEGVPGGTYTGVAATWQRKTHPDSTAFIVELGGSLAEGEALMHAEAILAVVPLVP